MNKQTENHLTPSRNSRSLAPSGLRFATTVSLPSNQSLALPVSVVADLLRDTNIDRNNKALNDHLQLRHVKSERKNDDVRGEGREDFREGFNDTCHDREETSEERMPSRSINAAYELCDDEEWLYNSLDCCYDQRSDVPTDARHLQISEEREGSPNDDNENDYLDECHLWVLQQDEEEARAIEKEREEDLRRNEEVRVLAVLDQLLQLIEEEYPFERTPSQHEVVGRGSRDDNDDIRANFDDDYDDSDGLDHLLLESTPGDSQIEELVALCERRDQSLEGSQPTNSSEACFDSGQLQSPQRINTALAPTTACVVCLETPRTHAYVPCGHFCVCFSCAKEQTKQQRRLASAVSCPVCQQPTSTVMRIFIP